MSLTGRFSTLFLSALALVLVGFSTALYVAARVHLERQLGERLTAALAVLAAAAEVHPEGVEWEPHERALWLGREPGAEQIRWVVSDERGQAVDHSQNLPATELGPAWTPRADSTDSTARLVDAQSRTWQLARRRLRPGMAESSSSSSSVRAASNSGVEETSPLDPSETPPHRSLVLSVGVRRDPLEATLATLVGFLAALSAGGWLAAASLCRRLSRQALAPLSRMAASARGLDASDAGWSLVEAGTGDELDELGRAFNDLLSRLHVAYERQRRFGSHASHQLRTPLTVLIGQIEVALRQERTGDEYRRVLRSALGRAVQLGQVLEALLFLGRAEGDAQLPRGEPIDLGAWLAAHVEDRPGVLARPAPDDPPIRIRAHPPLLGQLVDNLIDNALAYGRPTPGIPVVVEARREGRTAVLAVEDIGPGIAPDDLAHVFEPFYRSAEVRREGTPGVGLGLSVVQRIAQAFGGSASIRSAPGQGCRVEVRFPIEGDSGAVDVDARPRSEPALDAPRQGMHAK